MEASVRFFHGFCSEGWSSAKVKYHSDLAMWCLSFMRPLQGGAIVPPWFKWEMEICIFDDICGSALLENYYPFRIMSLKVISYFVLWNNVTSGKYDFRASQIWIESHFCILLAVWPCIYHINGLSLRFLTCNLGMLIVTSHKYLLETYNYKFVLNRPLVKLQNLSFGWDEPSLYHCFNYYLLSTCYMLATVQSLIYSIVDPLTKHL